MSTLIRFEDTFGTYNLYMNVQSNNGCFKAVNGLSNSKVLIISDGKAKVYSNMGITRLLFVLDMDNQGGDGSKVFSAELFSKQFSKTLDALNKYNIQYEFIPVAYCAETLELYQYYIGGQDIEELINCENTKKLHRQILECITGLDEKFIKNGSFIDYNSIYQGIKKYRNISKFNKCVIDLILDKDVEGYSLDEFIEYIENFSTYYRKCAENINHLCLLYENESFDIFNNPLREQFVNRFKGRYAKNQSFSCGIGDCC